MFIPSSFFKIGQRVVTCGMNLPLLFLVGDCNIFEKPWKVPAENVRPGCSIGSRWWNSRILNVSMQT